MEWVYASEKPKDIEYQKLPNGKAFVMLRKDAEEVTVTTEGEEKTEQKVWRYHEKQFMTGLTEEEVKAKADELFLTTGRQPTIEERLTALEEFVLATEEG